MLIPTTTSRSYNLAMPASYLSDPVVATFIVIPVALLVLLVLGVARAFQQPQRTVTAQAAAVAGIGVIWMAATWVVAANGVLHQWTATPPPFMVLAAGIIVLSLVLAFSSIGQALATLPLWLLIAVQSFRFPLEIAMHAMAERGIMPEQMSYTGRNVDIVTGISAIIVAALTYRGGARPLAWVWNVAGLVLVLNVTTVAILSTPRFAYFGNDRLNTWVADPPFVWLPAVMVLVAIAGHLVIFRALAGAGSRRRETGHPRR
jgi:hypothetical protein